MGAPGPRPIPSPRPWQMSPSGNKDAPSIPRPEITPGVRVAESWKTKMWPAPACPDAIWMPIVDANPIGPEEAKRLETALRESFRDGRGVTILPSQQYVHLPEPPSNVTSNGVSPCCRENPDHANFCRKCGRMIVRPNRWNVIISILVTMAGIIVLTAYAMTHGI